jgi:hypothetical protein
MAKKKISKKDKRSLRRKLSKLLTKAEPIKKRLPTCKGGYALKSKKDYRRFQNKKITQEELNA